MMSNVKTPHQREEEYVKKIENLLREIRDSYIGDPDNQNHLETEWCKKIDKLLGEEQCGIFSDDAYTLCFFDNGQNDALVLDFNSEEEALLAINQLIELLDIINEICKTAEANKYTHLNDKFTLQKMMDFADKLNKLRYGRMEF